MSDQDIDKIKGRLTDARFGYTTVTSGEYYKDVTLLLAERQAMSLDRANLIIEIDSLKAKVILLESEVAGHGKKRLPREVRKGSKS